MASCVIITDITSPNLLHSSCWIFEAWTASTFSLVLVRTATATHFISISDGTLPITFSCVLRLSDMLQSIHTTIGKSEYFRDLEECLVTSQSLVVVGVYNTIFGVHMHFVRIDAHVDLNVDLVKQWLILLF